MFKRLIIFITLSLCCASPFAHSAVNGSNVQQVVSSTSTFKKIGSFWYEQNTNKEVITIYEETLRDDWSVYLHNAAANKSLALDTWTNKVFISLANAPWSFLNDIEVASEHQVSPSGPTLYKNADYKGKAVRLDEGWYSVSVLTSLGVANNTTTSIRVPTGYKLQIFNYGTFTGWDKTLTNNVKKLGSTYNNKISSVRVIKSSSEISPAPFYHNLLVNPNGDSGDLTGWTITDNGGEGWQATTGGNSEGDNDNGFLTSHAWNRREQTIDLLAEGFTPEFMDAQPPIQISEIFQKVYCAGDYFINVELLDYNGAVLHTWASGEKTHTNTTCDYNGYKEQVSKQLTHYGPGVRYIRWQDGGKSHTASTGHQGTKLQNAFLAIAPINLLNKPGTLSAWTIVQNGGSGFKVTGDDDNRQFKTSNGWNKRKQLIDLIDHGFTADELDTGELPIHAYASYAKVECPDLYYLKVELLDASKNVIETFDSGVRTHDSDCDTNNYREVIFHRFTGYASGVRYLRWEDGGKASESKSGYFGTIIESPYIAIVNHDNEHSNSGRLLRGLSFKDYIPIINTVTTIVSYGAASLACAGTLGTGCAQAFVAATAVVGVVNIGLQSAAVTEPVDEPPVHATHVENYNINLFNPTISFSNTTLTDHYRNGRPYQLFNTTGSSQSTIQFMVPPELRSINDGYLHIKLNHCRTSANGMVNMTLNGSPYRTDYQSAPKHNFGTQDFEIPFSSLNMDEPNTFVIQLDPQSPGVYWLSDVAFSFETSAHIVKTALSERVDQNITGFVYEHTTITDTARPNRPYLQLDQANSVVSIEFYTPKNIDNLSNGTLRLALNHGGATSSSKVDMYLNNATYQAQYSPASVGSFGLEHIDIPFSQLNLDGSKNTFEIKLYSPGGAPQGNYWLSDFELSYNAVIPTVSQTNYDTYTKNWVLQQRANIQELSQIPRDDLSAWEFIQNAPAWFYLPYIPISPTELQVLLYHFPTNFVQVALEMKKINQQARGFHSELIYTDLPRKNALRHAYWMALTTRKFGANFAKDLGDAHEYAHVDLTIEGPFDHVTDKINNAIGIEIAKSNPIADLVTKVNDAWDDGQLAWAKDFDHSGSTQTATVSWQTPLNKLHTNYGVLPDFSNAELNTLQNNNVVLP